MNIEVTKIDLGILDLTKEGKVIVSDPCYEPDIWCAKEVEVRKGDYIARAVYGVVPGWGERVIELTINNVLTPKKKAVHLIGACGVDSGQCGFFESTNYRENHPNKETRKSESWYNRACKVTLNSRKHNCGMMGQYGALSESGLGDGCYNLYAGYDNRGQITALRLRFL